MVSAEWKVGTGRAGSGVPRRRWSIALLALAPVGVGCFWLATRSDAVGSGMPRDVRSVETGPLRTDRAAPGRAASEEASRWQLGTEVTFDLDYASFVQAADDDSRLFATTASGSLILTVLEAAEDKRLLALNAAGLATSFEGEDIESDTARLVRADLEHPCFIEFAPDGSVRGIWLRGAQQVRTRQLVRSLASAFQFVSSDDPQARRWSTRETDANGPAVAHYAWIGDVVEKRKGAPKLPIATPEEVRQNSLAKYRLDRHRFIERVDLEESSEIPLGAASLETRHEVHLRIRSERRTRTAAPDLGGYLRASLSGTKAGTSSADAERRDDEELARGQTFRGLTTELGELRPDGYTPEYGEARNRLVALLRTDERAVKECLEALRRNLEPGERASLLGALSDAGTAAAQGALMEVAKDPVLAADTRQQALINASLTDTPSADTLRDMSALAGSEDRGIRGQAALALGAATRTAAGSADPNTSGAAGIAASDLAARFRRANSPDEQMLYASALGNAGGPEALAVSKQLLGSGDPDLRARGANALRFVEGAEADRLLAEAALHDPSAEVRMSALSAAQYRSYNEALHTAVDAAARTDTDASVRNAALNVLSQYADSSASARETLSWMSQHDPDADLRAAAAQALTRQT